MSTPIQKRRAEVLSVVRSYVERELSRRLDLREPNRAVRPAPGGGKSLVFFVETNGTRCAVVYAFKKNAEAARFASALRLAERHYLPAPKLIHESAGWLARRRYGHALIASEFMTGEPLNPNADAAALTRPLADAMAQLHRVTSNRWGKPDALRSDSIKADWRQGALRRLRAAGLPPESEANLKTQLDRLLDALPEPREFQLCHHHLAPDDLLFDAAAKRIAFIDCGSLQFSRAARDLATLQLTVFGEHELAWRAFVDAYFNRMGEATREPTEREMRFFVPFLLLGKLRHQPPGSPERARLEERLRDLAAV